MATRSGDSTGEQQLPPSLVTENNAALGNNSDFKMVIKEKVEQNLMRKSLEARVADADHAENERRGPPAPSPGQVGRNRLHRLMKRSVGTVTVAQGNITKERARTRNILIRYLKPKHDAREGVPDEHPLMLTSATFTVIKEEINKVYKFERPTRVFRHTNLDLDELPSKLERRRLVEVQSDEQMHEIVLGWDGTVMQRRLAKLSRAYNALQKKIHSIDDAQATTGLNQLFELVQCPRNLTIITYQTVNLLRDIVAKHVSLLVVAAALRVLWQLCLLDKFPTMLIEADIVSVVRTRLARFLDDALPPNTAGGAAMSARNTAATEAGDGAATAAAAMGGFGKSVGRSAKSAAANAASTVQTDGLTLAVKGGKRGGWSRLSSQFNLNSGLRKSNVTATVSANEGHSEFGYHATGVLVRLVRESNLDNITREDVVVLARATLVDDAQVAKNAAGGLVYLVFNARHCQEYLLDEYGIQLLGNILSSRSTMAAHCGIALLSFFSCSRSTHLRLRARDCSVVLPQVLVLLKWTLREHELQNDNAMSPSNAAEKEAFVEDNPIPTRTLKSRRESFFKDQKVVLKEVFNRQCSAMGVSSTEIVDCKGRDRSAWDGEGGVRADTDFGTGSNRNSRAEEEAGNAKDDFDDDEDDGMRGDRATKSPFSMRLESQESRASVGPGEDPMEADERMWMKYSRNALEPLTEAEALEAKVHSYFTSHTIMTKLCGLTLWGFCYVLHHHGRLELLQPHMSDLIPSMLHTLDATRDSTTVRGVVSALAYISSEQEYVRGQAWTAEACESLLIVFERLDPSKHFRVLEAISYFFLSLARSGEWRVLTSTGALAWLTWFMRAPAEVRPSAPRESHALDILHAQTIAHVSEDESFDWPDEVLSCLTQLLATDRKTVLLSAMQALFHGTKLLQVTVRLGRYKCVEALAHLLRKCTGRALEISSACITLLWKLSFVDGNAIRLCMKGGLHTVVSMLDVPNYPALIDAKTRVVGILWSLWERPPLRVLFEQLHVVVSLRHMVVRCSIPRQFRVGQLSPQQRTGKATALPAATATSNTAKSSTTPGKEDDDYGDDEKADVDDDDVFEDLEAAEQLMSELEDGLWTLRSSALWLLLLMTEDAAQRAILASKFHQHEAEAVCLRCIGAMNGLRKISVGRSNFVGRSTHHAHDASYVTGATAADNTKRGSAAMSECSFGIMSAALFGLQKRTAHFGTSRRYIAEQQGVRALLRIALGDGGWTSDVRVMALHTLLNLSVDAHVQHYFVCPELKRLMAFARGETQLAPPDATVFAPHAESGVGEGTSVVDNESRLTGQASGTAGLDESDAIVVAFAWSILSNITKSTTVRRYMFRLQLTRMSMDAREMKAVQATEPADKLAMSVAGQRVYPIKADTAVVQAFNSFVASSTARLAETAAPSALAGGGGGRAEGITGRTSQQLADAPKGSLALMHHQLVEHGQRLQFEMRQVCDETAATTAKFSTHHQGGYSEQKQALDWSHGSQGTFSKGEQVAIQHRQARQHGRTRYKAQLMEALNARVAMSTLKQELLATSTIDAAISASTQSSTTQQGKNLRPSFFDDTPTATRAQNAAAAVTTENEASNDGEAYDLFPSADAEESSATEAKWETTAGGESKEFAMVQSEHSAPSSRRSSGSQQAPMHGLGHDEEAKESAQKQQGTQQHQDAVGGDVGGGDLSYSHISHVRDETGERPIRTDKTALANDHDEVLDGRPVRGSSAIAFARNRSSLAVLQPIPQHPAEQLVAENPTSIAAHAHAPSIVQYQAAHNGRPLSASMQDRMRTSMRKGVLNTWLPSPSPLLQRPAPGASGTMAVTAAPKRKLAASSSATYNVPPRPKSAGATASTRRSNQQESKRAVSPALSSRLDMMAARGGATGGRSSGCNSNNEGSIRSGHRESKPTRRTGTGDFASRPLSAASATRRSKRTNPPRNLRSQSPSVFSQQSGPASSPVGFPNAAGATATELDGHHPHIHEGSDDGENPDALQEHEMASAEAFKAAKVKRRAERERRKRILFLKQTRDYVEALGGRQVAGAAGRSDTTTMQLQALMDESDVADAELCGADGDIRSGEGSGIPPPLNFSALGTPMAAEGLSALPDGRSQTSQFDDAHSDFQERLTAGSLPEGEERDAGMLAGSGDNDDGHNPLQEGSSLSAWQSMSQTGMSVYSYMPTYAMNLQEEQPQQDGLSVTEGSRTAVSEESTGFGAGSVANSLPGLLRASIPLQWSHRVGPAGPLGSSATERGEDHWAPLVSSFQQLLAPHVEEEGDDGSDVNPGSPLNDERGAAAKGLDTAESKQQQRSASRVGFPAAENGARESKGGAAKSKPRRDSMQSVRSQGAAAVAAASAASAAASKTQNETHTRHGKKRLEAKEPRATEVILEPGGDRNRFIFREKAECIPRPDERVGLWRFKHVEGCQMCLDLYPHIEIDGEMWHLYHGSSIVCEVLDPGPYPTLQPPTEETVRLNAAWTPVALPVPSSSVWKLRIPHAPVVPPIQEHYLAGSLTLCSMTQSAHPGSACRLYGEFPSSTMVLFTDEEPPPKPLAPVKPQWDVNRSIFAPRKKECDARNFFNTKRVCDRMATKDWSRLFEMGRYRRLLSKSIKNQGFNVLPDDEEALQENEVVTRLTNLVREHYLLVHALFEHYSMLGSLTFSMTENSYYMFIADTGLVDDDGLTRDEVATIFIAVNLEEGGSSEENQANNDRSLVRHEWLETLVRLSIEKYPEDPIDVAFGNLMDRLKSTIPAHHMADPNDFRKQRLYNRAVDEVLAKHRRYLSMLYRKYSMLKPIGGQANFGIPEWNAFLSHCRLGGKAVTVRESNSAFVSSRMYRVEELKDRKRFTTMTWVEFVEALARVCDMMFVPTDEMIRNKPGAENAFGYLEILDETELEALEREETEKYNAAREVGYEQEQKGEEGEQGDAADDSTVLSEASTSSEASVTETLFARKLDNMLQLILCRLAQHYGGDTTEENKTIALTKYLTENQRAQFLS